MVRTQVQFTDEQAVELRSVAAESGVSLAAVSRQTLEAHLARHPRRGGDRRRQLALDAIGRFSADPGLATDHSQAFADSAGELR
jgi:hypothetical protein